MKTQRSIFIATLIIGFLSVFVVTNLLTLAQTCNPASTTGDDNITCSGAGLVPTLEALDGNDTVTIDNTVNDTSFTVAGDNNYSTGSGADTITNNGTIDYIYGDSINQDGSGADNIDNNGVVTYIFGDTAGGTGSGDDTIVNDGYVSSYIAGDDYGGGGSGDDTIINNGTVNDIFSDSVYADGSGNDTVINNGTVNSSILGDNINGIGTSSDTITNNGNASFISGDSYDGTGSGADTINNTGTVGNIYGDSVNGSASGNDTITNSGTVTGNIYSDSEAVSGTGADSITNSGTVNGNIIAGGGNDNVTLQDGAQVGGTIDGGADYDILTFEFTSSDANQLDALAADIAAQSPSGGTIIYMGNSYTWTNFEELQQLLTHLGIAGNSAPFQGFCANTEWSAFDVYVIDGNGNGEYAFSVTAGRIVWGLRIAREEDRRVWLNAGLDAAMYALQTGELLITMPGYDFVFDYVAMCGPLPDEEDPVTDIIIEEPEEVETLPVMSIINRPR